MVLPEWWNLRLPINQFTLVWATTKPETLSQPMKNRFVYHFHFMEYNDDEKKAILWYYLNHYNLNYEEGLLDAAVKKVAPVPREIHNFVIKLRDFIVSNKIEKLSTKELESFLKHAQIDDWWMMPIHKKYLEPKNSLWSK